MKILCAEYNQVGEVAIVPVGDDVLLRNNGDFYLPEFTRELSCVPQLVVRLCKLGKTVSERFAGRYYEEIGVGIRFYADSFARELREKGLPEGVASSFDGSAAISPLLPIDAGRNQEYILHINDKMAFNGNLGSLPVALDRLISLASDFHTLKIGDFLYCGNVFRYRGLRTGDHLQMTLDGKRMLDFYIK